MMSRIRLTGAKAEAASSALLPFAAVLLASTLLIEPVPSIAPLIFASCENSFGDPQESPEGSDRSIRAS
jgi:hypothetical protein